MWHEARKQERLIRGMIVDYRRRAERRKDFYEKIKAEPTQFLQLHGRPCKVHLDPAIAIAGEGPAIMMPWQGDNNNMIDRFDVRAHLDFIPEVRPTDISPDELEQEERQCNYERYRILAQNVFLGIGEEKFLQQLAIEEQFGVTIEEKEAQRERLNDKKTTGAAIGYNYNNPGEQPSSSYGTVIKKEEPKESDDDSDLEIIDVDLSIDVNKMEASQAHELNAVGPQFGMAGCDLFSFLTGDADDAEHQKQLLREEKEKAMFSGRKSRRERRAHRDKKLASRVVSTPSYAAPSDEPAKSPSRSPSRSPSPDAGNIEFITSFGGEEEVKPPIPQKPLYADKLKLNLKKRETYSEVARKPTIKKLRSHKAQVTYLCKYMAEHKDFATGKLSIAQTGRQWLQIKAALDKLGPHRTVEQWKICWRDQKRKARNQGAVNKVKKPTVPNNPTQNSINTQLILNTIEQEAALDSPIINSESIIRCVPVEKLVQEKPVPDKPKPPPPKPIIVAKNLIRRVIYPPDRYLNAQLELNSLMKELIKEVRVSNRLREEMIQLKSVEDRKRPVMGPHRPKSRSRSRSYSRSRSRSRSDSRSRSRSRRRSTSSNSRSRSYSPYKRSSRSRSRSRNYRRRSRSPVNHTVGYGRHDSRSSNESNEKAGSSKATVPRYYGRKKEDRSSSELSVDSESSDSPSELKTKSVESYKSYSNQNQLRNSGHSTKGSSRETLSLKEKLKRKMQAQLSRQLRADKRAEAERLERESRRQARRDHEMRELAIKLRRKQREMRHQQNRRSSEEDSHSDGSHSGSSFRDSPPPEKKNDRFRSRSPSPKEQKRVPVWDNDRDPQIPPYRQKLPEIGENYPPKRQDRRMEDERNYPIKYDRPPRDFRDHGKSDNYYRSDYQEERWGDNCQPDKRRPYGQGNRGGFRGHGFRYGGDGPSNWNPRDNQDNRDDQSKKIKLVDY